MPTCRGCHVPYTFQNAKAVRTRDWQNYCSPTCEDKDTDAIQILEELLEYIKTARPSKYAKWRDFEKREMAAIIERFITTKAT